jgi:hypothetical protein
MNGGGRWVNLQEQKNEVYQLVIRTIRERERERERESYQIKRTTLISISHTILLYW